MIDIETNGFSREADDIVEIAVVYPEGPTLALETLLKPRRRVGNRDVHGITNRDIRKAPRFAALAGTITRALADRTVVAHNAPFDVGFLEHALSSIGWSTPLACICTLDLHRTLFGRPSDLESACADVGIRLSRTRHSAAEDALATAELFLRQVALLRDREHSLAEFVTPGATLPRAVAEGYLDAGAPLRKPRIDRSLE